MMEHIDAEGLKEDYREDFISNSTDWRLRVDVTNSIIEKTLEDLEVDKEFDEFTYNEYCALCEKNFNRIIEESKIGYDSDDIITSKYYCDIIDYGGGEHKEAFRLAVEKTVGDQLESFYERLNRENFISAMQEKCGEYMTTEDVDALTEIWEKNI